MASDKPRADKLYIAVETFTTASGASATAGSTMLWGDDALVRSHPQFFRLADVNRPDVEDASSDPGEKRGGKR